MKKCTIMALVAFLFFGLSSQAPAQLVAPTPPQVPQDTHLLALEHYGINGDQQRIPYLSVHSGLWDRNGSKPGTDPGSSFLGAADSPIAQEILPILGDNQSYLSNILTGLNTTISGALDRNGSGNADSAPIPAAAWLFGGGLLSLICVRRKRGR
jgi:hypothetical protein